MPTFTDRFDSISEMMEALAKRPIRWDDPKSVKDGYRSSWCGVESFAEAERLALRGWEKGRDKLSKEIEACKGSVGYADVPSLVHDVAGFMPDIPAAIVGIPDCMINHGDVEALKRPVIGIAIDIAESDHVRPEAITKRGAAVLSYIDALEQAGFRCEINFYISSDGGSNTYNFIVKAKGAGEVLDIDRMAFCLMHPAMLRKLFFRGCEQHNIEATHGHNYGSVTTLKKNLMDTLNVQLNFGGITNVGGYGDSVESALKNVKRQINQQLKEQGVHFGEESEAA